MRNSLLALGAILIVACLGAVPAAAQQLRIRGRIMTVDGSVLSVQTREGPTVKVRLADGFSATATIRAALGDIKPHSFIGTAALPQPDGTLMALEIHIFPEQQRGVGEGSHDFDLKPGSSMTNATVTGSVADTGGPIFTLTYPGGEKRVSVSPDTPIVTFVPATAADVKPGIGIIVFSAEPASDGSFTAKRILIGKDGVDPPM
jgi:hypothetical protein